MRRFLISPINLPNLIDVSDKCSSLVIQLEVLQQGNAKGGHGVKSLPLLSSIFSNDLCS